MVVEARPTVRLRPSVGPRLMLLLLLLFLAGLPLEVRARPDPKAASGTPTYQGPGVNSLDFGRRPAGPPPTSTTLSPSMAPDASASPTPPQPGTYEIMSVDFKRVETPFFIGLWIFCASLAKIGFHMTPSLSKMFPESCLLIVVGVAIGLFLFVTNLKEDLSPLTPDTFFLYMLPPIILDAGYFMPNRLFFDHLGTILWYAVVGTIFNTLTIGTSLWAVGQLGWFGIDKIPLLDMLLFSALISAVDPVAVLAVFEEIHVNEILYIVVFGESLLNDAVTVAYTAMGLDKITYRDYLTGFASFFVVGLGGTIIGVVWGFGTGFVTKFTNQVRVIEPIFIFVMAYMCYLNAEMFHLSGIMAITFCGITMKNYVESNISHKSHTTVKYAMKMLSSSSETVIFMFLGVSTVTKDHDWNTSFVFFTILFCSVYRAIGVIVLTAVVNPFRLYKLDRVEKFVMSYGGLRGAVAFALVLLINKHHVPLQPMFVTTTIAVIYFTVFIQGITIKPLVKILNVKRAEKRKPTMNERIHERFMDHTMAGIEDILGRHGNHHLRDKFKRFDYKFIRPCLQRDHQGAEPKILETFSKLTMKDAMELMKRNASTVGNISGTESMSAIFRNYTTNNLNGSDAVPTTTDHLQVVPSNELVEKLAPLVEELTECGTPPSAVAAAAVALLAPLLCMSRSASFNQLDSSTWNIDMQELEYNPSRKDLTDAKIHHLLAEELCKPYRRHRRLSYSRHAVNDRDLSTQEVNYRMHMNHIRRIVTDERKHHHKRSKRLGKDGKQNHVSFPGIQQNGSAKQFTHDYIDEVIHEADCDLEGAHSSKDDWEGGITFTVHPSPSGLSLSPEPPSMRSHIVTVAGPDPRRALLVKQYSKPVDYDDEPTVAEVSLPWRREGEEAVSVSDAPRKSIHSPKSSDGPDSAASGGSGSGGGDLAGGGGRVSTPTATESVLPWKRDDDSGDLSGPVKQSEFPAWCTNKEYLAYSSPSATFLGGIEQPKTASVIGLFRRDSSWSGGSRTASQAGSEASLHRQGSVSPSGPANIFFLDESGGSGGPSGSSSPPGGLPAAASQGTPTSGSLSRRPISVRRGSLLELTASVDPIPEEDAHSASTQTTTPSPLPMGGATGTGATGTASSSPAHTGDRRSRSLSSATSADELRAGLAPAESYEDDEEDEEEDLVGEETHLNVTKHK